MKNNHLRRQIAELEQENAELYEYICQLETELAVWRGDELVSYTAHHGCGVSNPTWVRVSYHFHHSLLRGSR